MKCSPQDTGSDRHSKKEQDHEGESLFHAHKEEPRHQSPDNHEQAREEYIQANLNQDSQRAESLYESSHARCEQEELRKASPLLYSADMNYIHEPYWSYNVSQLKAYGKRIIQKIQPFFIEEGFVNESDGKVNIDDKWIKIRRVYEFGRVLPLLYLQEQLGRENNPNLSVPRLFIVPNKENDVHFNFSLPYIDECHSRLVLDSGNNILKVESDSFTIYQEYIEGMGEVGDRSFLYYGHTDFNAKQVINSKETGRKVLIDTKESKNFFIAPLNPMKDGFYSYCRMNIGRILPQEAGAFQKWQIKHQKLMLQSKAIHFPIGLKSIDVNIGKLNELSFSEEVTQQNSVMFDEGCLYFSDPEPNLTRYLMIGRYDLFLKLLIQNPSHPLSDVLNPILFNNQNTLIELILDLLSNAHLEKKEENASILGEILSILIYRAESSSESEQLKLMELIAPKSETNTRDMLSYDLGTELLKKLLQKQEKPSSKLLEYGVFKHVLRYQDTSLLEMVLDFSEIQIIESLLNRMLEKQNISEGNISMLINPLLGRLGKLSDRMVSRIISFNNREIIEHLLKKEFDAGPALYLVAKIIDESSQSYIRKLLGKGGEINWYWYDIAEKILARNPSDEYIDQATAYALNNGKIQLVEMLLKQKPKHLPKTDGILKQILNSPYSGDLLFENAIQAQSILLIDLFLEHGKTIATHQFRKALQTRSDRMLQLLSQSGNLQNPVSALKDAIDYRSINAISLLAKDIKNITSDVFFDAIKTKDDVIIDIIKEALPKGESMMQEAHIDKIFEDKEAVEKLVGSEIDLDKSLFFAVKKINDPCHNHIRFLMKNTNQIDGYWYDVVQRILKKQPSGDAIDKSIAYALNNSKILILENLLEVKPQSSPKTDEILKQILNSPYSGDLLFENAIKSNNERVVKLLLNNGKMASQYQCGLAYGAKMKDLLESQASLSKISAQKRFING